MGKSPIPNAVQFQKGQSGNPNGRPKGRQDNATILKKYLNTILKSKDLTGADIEVPAWDIMNMRMIAEAIEGNTTAYNAIIDRIEGKPKQSVDSTINTGKNLNIIVTDPNAADNLAKLDTMLKAPPPEEPEDDD